MVEGVDGGAESPSPPPPPPPPPLLLLLLLPPLLLSLALLFLRLPGLLGLSEDKFSTGTCLGALRPIVDLVVMYPRPGSVADLPACRRRVRVAPTSTVVLVRAADVVPIPTVVLEGDVPAVPTLTAALGVRVGGVFNVHEAGDP